MKQVLNRNKPKGGALSSALVILKNFVKKFAKGKAVKAIEIIAVLAAVAAGGFFAGRKTTEPVQLPPEIIYLPGDSIEVEKPYPEPVYIKVPVDSANVIADCVKSGKFKELFPETIRDSIVYVTKEDTAAVIRDWATVRFYNEKVFDVDTVGAASVAAKVQYNRLEFMNVTFVPVQKNTTVTKVVGKKYSPFVGGGITTMPSYIINAGIYFDDKYGTGIMFQRDWKDKRSSVGLVATYKF